MGEKEDGKGGMNRLKQLREDLYGCSRRALSKRLGIPEKYYRELEAGLISPMDRRGWVDAAKTLACFFDIPIEEIFLHEGPLRAPNRVVSPDDIYLDRGDFYIRNR